MAEDKKRPKVRVRTSKLKTAQKERARASAIAAEFMSEAERMALLQMSQSSCEIIEDAQGRIKLTVKAYADSAQEAADNAIDVFTNAKIRLGLGA